MTLSLREYLIERTGDVGWPSLADDRVLSRSLLAVLPGVIEAGVKAVVLPAENEQDSAFHARIRAREGGAGVGVDIAVEVSHVPFQKLSEDHIGEP